MKPKNCTKVSVLDPTTGQSVDAKEWVHRDDRTSAEWVIIENTRYGFRFALHKRVLTNDNFAAAQKAAAGFAEGGRTGTRIEWITIYNAIHTAHLNDVLTKIGGNAIARLLYWTEEMDEDESSAPGAWFYHGTGGFLNTNTARFCSMASRVIRAL